MNLKKQLIETTKETETWNNIRLRVHDADLDSNVKLIIGEAAIANGWWDGMAWEDKQAILKDNFSEVVYKAIVDEGTWDKLSWEEQIAVLNNEFSDTVIQALIDEGQWKKLPFEEKKAILTTNSPNTLKQILKDFGIWDELKPKTQKLLADNQPVKKSTKEAKRELDEYGNIIVKKPVVSVQDNVTSEVTKMQQRINQLKGKTVYIDAIARASGSASSKKFIEGGGSFLHAKGTNFHKGGPAIVNDQKGPLFRELIQYPAGETFIPYGRNVYIPDMPRGSKVLKASFTKQRFPNLPQYQDGIGNIPVRSTVIQNIRNTQSRISEGASRNLQIEVLLQAVIRRLDDLRNKKDITEINQTNHIQGNSLSERELAREHQIMLEKFAYKLGII